MTADFCPEGCYWACEHREQTWLTEVNFGNDDLVGPNPLVMMQRMHLTLDERVADHTVPLNDYWGVQQWWKVEPGAGDHVYGLLD